MNKDSKFNTLEEVMEALRSIDREAALYLWKNFDEEDFQQSAELNLGPLDFFSWHIHGDFDWRSLNSKLKQSDIDTMSKTNLDDYTTKDIDFIGCDPVIADALKQNKSILCKVWDTNDFIKKLNIVMYEKSGAYPYITNNSGSYKNAEPIEKTKTELTELRVKDPVKVMQYLIDNGYIVDKSGFFQKGNERYCPRSLFAYCGSLVPEGWPLPELLEEVAVKCKKDEDSKSYFAMDDPFKYS